MCFLFFNFLREEEGSKRLNKSIESDENSQESEDE